MRRMSPVLFVSLFIMAGAVSSLAGSLHVATSSDGTPIAYEVHGAGQPTLLFVHGWSCDSRYWRKQVDDLARDYRVIVMDLAGHGHSGFDRRDYTMTSFGEDVQAVMNAAGGEDFILIGHSMGGAVIAQAARGASQSILGLVVVDTFHNVEWPMTSEDVDGMVAPLEQNFREACRPFVASMMNESTTPELREWILADMSSAPKDVALSAMRNLMGLHVTGDAARVFEEVRIPVVALNADLWPTDAEANRRHMLSFELVNFEGGDHFLMLNQPEAFNTALRRTVAELRSQGQTERK